MMSEMEVTALRNDAAQRLFELEAESQRQTDDEGDDLPAVRAARRDRLRVAVDVLTHVLRGG